MITVYDTKKNNHKTRLARFIVTTEGVGHLCFGLATRSRTFSLLLVPRAVRIFGANGVRGGLRRFAPGISNGCLAAGVAVVIDTSVGVGHGVSAARSRGCSQAFARFLLPITLVSLGASSLRGGPGPFAFASTTPGVGHLYFGLTAPT